MTSAQQRAVQVSAAEAGTRLDVVLARAFPDLSRSMVQRLVEAGLVSLGGRTARASDRPRAGDLILVQIPPPQATHLVPTEMPLAVVYEDDDVLVIDKPAGLVVHPAPGHPDDTLVNALLARYPNLTVGNSLRPGIVHRLDKDTSGLLVVARNDRAMASLVDQMKRRTVRKEYLALVRGNLSQEHGLIEAPIGRDPRARQRMAVVADGREARTWFRVLERLGRYTLVEARLETGRTHQIRVHLASIGHPVAGDQVYGPGRTNLPLRRQFLHAYRLGFALPGDGRPVLFESPLPEDLRGTLDAARAEEHNREQN
jgi:23S rRNA pseudouridine1911/1915/1917 synthase